MSPYLDSMHKMHEAMQQVRASGDPDRDFLAFMIPHHEGAVMMAEVLLNTGRDPLVRQLAADIIATQQAEIVAMRSRLAVLEHGANPMPDGFPALGGSRG
jgi:uncharacterized protein (DUF305 family)